LAATFGYYYAYLLFQDMLSMSDDTWGQFMHQAWFPFIHLRQQTVRAMIGAAKSRMPIDDFLDAIEADVVEAVQGRLANWKAHPVLGSHHKIIEAAFKHLVGGDHLSASLIIFLESRGSCAHTITAIRTLQRPRKPI